MKKGYECLNGRPLPEAYRKEYNRLTAKINWRENGGLRQDQTEYLKDCRHRVFAWGMEA